MKKSIFFAGLTAVLLLPACNKTLPAVSELSEPISLTVDVNDGPTRATGVTSNSSSGEAKVNSLQVFVFNGDNLDGYKKSTGTTTTVSCTAGVREIYAVVNAADLSAVVSKSALLSQVATLTADGANFLMIGSTSETLQKSSAVSVSVNRLAARVVLKGVKNSLTNNTLAADFKLKAVYLTNVAGDIDLGASPTYTVSHWYNQRGYQAGNNLGNFTYDAVNSAISAGGTHSTAHYFYAMPNAHDAAVGGPWSPRATKLVIQCVIGGITYDYPITLPALQSNYSYEIDLVTLTRPGNLDDGQEPDDNHPDDTDEEDPVVGFDQDFKITITPWHVVNVTEGTTI